jgi:hypothetical protein
LQNAFTVDVPVGEGVLGFVIALFCQRSQYSYCCRLVTTLKGTSGVVKRPSDLFASQY